MSSRKQPVIVFFYMIGCPHCEHMKPTWEKFKSKAKSRGVSVQEIESSNVKPEDNVQGFPTVVKKVSGKEVKRLTGSQEAAALEALLSKTRGGRTIRRRRITRRRR